MFMEIISVLVRWWIVSSCHTTLLCLYVSRWK